MICNRIIINYLHLHGGLLLIIFSKCPALCVLELLRDELRLELCAVLERADAAGVFALFTSELSKTSLELKSNNSGRTGLFSLSLTHGGSNSLGGGESERFVFLFPNKLSSTYEGENLTGLYFRTGEAWLVCEREDVGRDGEVGQ